MADVVMDAQAQALEALKRYWKGLRAVDKPTVDKIVEWLCAGAREPVVIFVLGSYGTGKSVFLEMICPLLDALRALHDGPTAPEFTAFESGGSHQSFYDRAQACFDRDGSHCLIVTVLTPYQAQARPLRQCVRAQLFPWAKHVWHLHVGYDHPGATPDPISAARRILDRRGWLDPPYNWHFANGPNPDSTAASLALNNALLGWMDKTPARLWPKVRAFFKARAIGRYWYFDIVPAHRFVPACMNMRAEQCSALPDGIMA